MVSLEQQSKLEAKSKIDEVLREKELLEEENMAQKHIIHLEKLKTEKEYAETREQKSRLMAGLEQEKLRLERDIDSLRRNKELKMNTSKRDSSTVSLGGGLTEGSILKGSELVRVAMMLQEASAICKGLNKPMVSETQMTTYTEHLSPCGNGRHSAYAIAYRTSKFVRTRKRFSRKVWTNCTSHLSSDAHCYFFPLDFHSR